MGDDVVIKELERVLMQYKLQPSSLGAFREKIMSCLRMLSKCHSKRKLYRKAIGYNEECIRMMTLTYGEKYPQTLACTYSLALDYDALGDFSKALEIHKDCLLKRSIVLGDTDEETLKSKASVAILEKKLKDYDYITLSSTSFSPASSTSDVVVIINAADEKNSRGGDDDDDAAQSQSPSPSPSLLTPTQKLTSSSSSSSSPSSSSSYSAAVTTSSAQPPLSSSYSSLKAQVFSSSSSPFESMKMKEIIELIERRGLDRSGLTEKTELVDLLRSTNPNLDDEVDIRGATLPLFRAVGRLALLKNSDASIWSIEKIRSLVIGGQHILKPECNGIDPKTTLTFGNQCPLIDLLLTKHYDLSNKHPQLELSYKEAVGRKAHLFITFAYTDNFFELVASIEHFLRENSKKYPVDSTCFWFDPFINDQWSGILKSFDWLNGTFRDAVKKIGHTLCFMPRWEGPSVFDRAWCLLEIRYSPLVSIITTPGEINYMKDRLITYNKVLQLLDKIDINNAITSIEQDKIRILDVVRSMEDGCHGFNVKITAMLRGWFHEFRTKIANSLTNSISQLIMKGQNAKNVGRHAEAKLLFEDALRIAVKQFGEDSEEAVVVMSELATTLQKTGEMEAALKLSQTALLWFERTFGPSFPASPMHILKGNQLVYTLIMCLRGTKKYEEARVLCEKWCRLSEAFFGFHHDITIQLNNCLAITLRSLKRFEESKALYERIIQSAEERGGVDCLEVALYYDNLGVLLCNDLNRYEEAYRLSARAYEIFKKVRGEHHFDTICCGLNVAQALFSCNKLDEAKDLTEDILAKADKGLSQKSGISTSCVELLVLIYGTLMKSPSPTAVHVSGINSSELHEKYKARLKELFKRVYGL